MSEDLAIVVPLRRAAIYRLLSLALAYPTPPRLQAVATESARVSVGAPAALAGGLRRLAEAARRADAETLAAEHIALFQRQHRCPPYEGAYGPPRLAGKATLLADVAGFYRAFGLEPAAGQPEVEDHVCAELEFMSVLALKEAWALGEDAADMLDVTRAAARSFLTDHLGRWGAAFAARVRETVAPGVLPAAAALLAAWLDAECARLEVAPSPLEGVSEAESGAFACPMAREEPRD